jgi:hypothetical protein
MTYIDNCSEKVCFGNLKVMSDEGKLIYIFYFYFSFECVLGFLMQCDVVGS